MNKDKQIRKAKKIYGIHGSALLLVMSRAYVLYLEQPNIVYIYIYRL